MIVEIEGISLHLAHPDELPVNWVGQEEVMRQLLAAWLVVDPQDLPMNPRLLGKPGVGKTTLAYAAAKRLGREVYILQATVDTRPEDLLITPGDRRRKPASLCRIAVGFGDAARRNRDSGRRQSYEREELGEPGSAAR